MGILCIFWHLLESLKSEAKTAFLMGDLLMCGRAGSVGSGRVGRLSDFEHVSSSHNGDFVFFLVSFRDDNSHFCGTCISNIAR